MRKLVTVVVPAWLLAAFLVAPLVTQDHLLITEFVVTPTAGEFIEIYNPNPQPVELSGLHLSDDLGDHLQHRIADLSFIGVGEHGFVEFIADGEGIEKRVVMRNFFLVAGPEDDPGSVAAAASMGEAFERIAAGGPLPWEADDEPSLQAQVLAEVRALVVAEVEAAQVTAQTDILAAEGKIQEARSAHQQAVDELATKQEIYRRNPGAVAVRDIERLQVVVQGRQGGIDAATAAKSAAEAQISTLLPAQKASAEAALAQAEVELQKTVVRAGVSGRVEQFTLRVGDVVNPFMRPAGEPEQIVS